MSSIAHESNSGHATRKAILHFSDGVEKSISVEPSETVLAAALRCGVSLMHQCMSGSCGTCVGKVRTGSLVMRSTTGHCLLPSELHEGQRLICLSSAATDVRLEFDYPSSLLGGDRIAPIGARVVALDWLAANVVRLRLSLPEDMTFDFLCGQYVRVRVPGTDEWRSYSMASTPADLPEIELLVRVLPRGAMSDFIRNQCELDQTIEIQGPHGVFFWRDSRAPHVMIAGGTGLAPMLGMLEQVRRLSGKRPPVILSFGCASPESLFHLDELEARESWMPNLSVRVTVDRAEAGYEGSVGDPVHAVTAADIANPDAVAYLCGPPPMIEAARAHLRSLGVRPENIFAELFAPSSQSAPLRASGTRLEQAP